MTTLEHRDERSERRLHRLGVAGVVVLWLPIFVWMAHLSSSAVLAVYVRDHPGWRWTAYLDTGICAAVTTACIVAAIAIGLSVQATVRQGTPEGRTRFLAWQGILAGLANLALILTEGSYVLFLSPGRR